MAARDPVRIVVAEPSPRQGGGKLGTVEALRRIGRGVRIEVVHDAAAAIELARSTADLVVLDRDLGAEGERILAALRRDGPPVVIVTAEATADVALETFKSGAADCVTASADYAEVLAGRRARADPRLARRARNGAPSAAACATSNACTRRSSTTFPQRSRCSTREGRIVTVNPEFERAFAGGGRHRGAPARRRVARGSDQQRRSAGSVRARAHRRVAHAAHRTRARRRVARAPSTRAPSGSIPRAASCWCWPT